MIIWKVNVILDFGRQRVKVSNLLYEFHLKKYNMPPRRSPETACRRFFFTCSRRKWASEAGQGEHKTRQPSSPS